MPPAAVTPALPPEEPQPPLVLVSDALKGLAGCEMVADADAVQAFASVTVTA